MPDVRVDHHGSIVFLVPMSDAGRLWLENNIGPENGYQPHWPTVLVEPRYVTPIIEGMLAEDLTVFFS